MTGWGKWAGRVVLALVILIVFLPSGSAGASTAPIKLVINGQTVKPKTPPITKSGRTLVPLRVVSEGLGATVQWNGETSTITIVRRERRIILTLGAEKALVDGKEILLEVPAQLIKETTYVPLRFVGEALGANVNWDAQTRTVFVDRGATRVTAMRWEKLEGYARLTLDISEPMDYSANTLSDPDRLLVDLKPAALDLEAKELSLGDASVAKVTAKTLGDKGRTARLTLELTAPSKYQVSLSPDGKSMYIDISYRVTSVDYRLDGKIPTISISTTGPVGVKTTELPDPARLVLDLPGLTVGAGVPKAMPVDLAWMTQIRTSQFQSDPGQVRVVLDLKQFKDYQLLRSDTGLVVRFVPQITGVTWAQLGAKTRVTLTTSLPVDHTLQAVPGEKRLILDIPQGISNLDTSRFQVDDGTIGTIRLEPGTAPDSTRLTVDLPYYLGHEPVAAQDGHAISFDILTSPVYQRSIMIDAGHGGEDPGAIGPKGTKEKDINLEIAHQLRTLLEQAGASIIMTRNGDYQVPLHDRPKVANEAKPDIFVSIHNNSYMRDSSGTETYYYTTNKNSKALAENIHSELIKGLGLPDRRVRVKDFVVVRDTLAPSVLLEIAFLSNPKEEKLLLDPGFRLKAAESIRRGIFQYFWELRSQAEVGRS